MWKLTAEMLTDEDDWTGAYCAYCAKEFKRWYLFTKFGPI